MLQNTKQLETRINEMLDKIYDYDMNGIGSKKTINGYRRSVDLLTNIQYAVKEKNIEYIAHENDNLGVIVEAIVKSYLKGKPQNSSGVGQIDLVQGSRKFEIKLVTKGSSSYASTLRETDMDVLIISNLGAYILRKENLNKAINQGYFKKGELKLKPTILNSDLIVETSFTKRLTEDLNLQAWY